MTSSSLPPLPEKIEGAIFTEIVPQLTPEIHSEDLLKLGAIVSKKGSTEKYKSLTTSARKIQWVKLNALRAIFLEEEFAKQREPRTFLHADPALLVEHRLNVTDCIIHTKSALDSIAVFLTDLLMLTATGGDRDLKKPQFRESVAQKDTQLGQLIMRLEPWLNDLQKIRDEWIHRSLIRTAIIQGRSEVGILPIPKDVTLELDAFKLPLTRENFWSTSEFVEHHYSNLVSLFQDIVERCIQIEEEDLSEPVQTPTYAKRHFILWPTYVSEDMTINKIKVYFGPGATSKASARK